MIVVSNTSPIMNLAAIGKLELLQQLYNKVVIPQAVYSELTIEDEGQPGEQKIQTLKWIETRIVSDQSFVEALRGELDDGEAEAIALSKELKTDLLLLDERRGRAVATRFGLRFIGLLGILIDAKQKGYIPAIKPILDDLVANAGFWVSQQLYAHVLRAAGE